jgi:hypothetical protein
MESNHLGVGCHPVPVFEEGGAEAPIPLDKRKLLRNGRGGNTFGKTSAHLIAAR